MTKISPPPWTFDPKHGAIYDRRHDFPIIHLHGDRWKENGSLATESPDLQVALRELMAAIDKTLDPTIAGDLSREISALTFQALLRKLLEPELTGARAALARSEGK